MQGGRLDDGGLDGDCEDGGFHSGVMYAAVIPPSTRNVDPFTYDDSSLAKKKGRVRHLLGHMRTKVFGSCE